VIAAGGLIAGVTEIGTLEAEIHREMVLFSIGKKWENHGKMLQNLVPSGKLSHNYGKSPFLMGKSTINGHFQ
jgi:hypothetical protein